MLGRDAKRRYGSPNEIVKDRLWSWGPAAKELGFADKQVAQRWLNSRAENSHLTSRWWERTMKRFRRMPSLQRGLNSGLFQNNFNFVSSVRCLWWWCLADHDCVRFSMLCTVIQILRECVWNKHSYTDLMNWGLKMGQKALPDVLFLKIA